VELFLQWQVDPRAQKSPSQPAPHYTIHCTHGNCAYSGKTISNYLHRVWAWHILHSIPQHLEKHKMNTMLQTADKLTSSSFKKRNSAPTPLA
jgi:hypothetical protein